MRLDDADFQNKMQELADQFKELKSEILLVREKGYENTEIIEKSESFFDTCDQATGLAEKYSQKKATALSQTERVVVGDIIWRLIMIGWELVKALRYAAQNAALRKKVYLDEATGLPNKNKSVMQPAMHYPQILKALLCRNFPIMRTEKNFGRNCSSLI